MNHPIIVSELQCWKRLSSLDIGAFSQNSAIVKQGKNKLGVYSVKGVSFRVKEKERLVILGTAGSGRSSLLQSIVGLDSALSGSVILNGHI